MVDGKWVLKNEPIFWKDAMEKIPKYFELHVSSDSRCAGCSHVFEEGEQAYFYDPSGFIEILKKATDRYIKGAKGQRQLVVHNVVLNCSKCFFQSPDTQLLHKIVIRWISQT